MEFAVLPDFLMMSRKNWLEPTIVAGACVRPHRRFSGFGLRRLGSSQDEACNLWRGPGFIARRSAVEGVCELWGASGVQGCFGMTGDWWDEVGS